MLLLERDNSRGASRIHSWTNAFLIYINDLTDDLKCNIKLFADDTSIFRVVDNPFVAASDLNHDLEAIESWAKTWRISFNPDSSKRVV